MSQETGNLATLQSRAKLIDGALIADAIKSEVAYAVRELIEMSNVRPGLAVVRVGENDASAVYVGSKVKTSAELGLLSEHHHFAETITTEELLAVISNLNSREEIDGVLVQLPLPKHVNERLVLETIDPAKDVDGFHPINVGRLSLGQECLAPCTPTGIIEMLDRSEVQISGARAVVIGRSHIVGRPLAQLLLQRDATVTICHTKTKDLPAVTREADILIAAIGRPAFVRGEFIKPGATVIDVGMSKVTDESAARGFFTDDLEKRLAAIAKRGFTLIGDVHPAEADRVAGLRSPVPGGVGLLTVAMLMKNTVKATRLRRGI